LWVSILLERGAARPLLSGRHLMQALYSSYALLIGHYPLERKRTTKEIKHKQM
jgi:hypothetical protein